MADHVDIPWLRHLDGVASWTPHGFLKIDRVIYQEEPRENHEEQPFSEQPVTQAEHADHRQLAKLGSNQIAK